MDQLLYGRVFGLPVWVVGLVVIGGAVAVYLIFFRNRSSSSSSSTLGQNSAGQQSAVPPVDQSLYDPYTGAPLAVETATNPATGLPNYNTLNGLTGPTAPGTSVTGGQSTDPYAGLGGLSSPGAPIPGYTWTEVYPGHWFNLPPPQQPAKPNFGTQVGTIRAAGSIPQYAGYDAGNPQGVPIDATPGGQGQGYAAFGSQVQVAGPGIQGPSNLAGTGQQGGSNLWYPVAGGGYVSASDLTGAPHGGAAGPYQATPWWPVMMDMPVRKG